MNEPWARYPDLVVGVASFDYLVREGWEQCRAKLLLVDGSNWRVSEVRVDGLLVRYSYYWLDESDRLIAGWDNAPHHSEIRTHPHHVHTARDVLESSIRDLDGALALLRQRLVQD